MNLTNVHKEMNNINQLINLFIELLKWLLLIKIWILSWVFMKHHTYTIQLSQFTNLLF